MLKSQHAGAGRLPHCGLITKRLIMEGRVRGPEIGGLDGKERGMKCCRMTERKWGSGHYLQYELQIVFRGREKPPPDVWIFCFLELWNSTCSILPSTSLFSLVKPRPNHKPPCVISQQCFWPPGLMAQCSLYDMYCLKGRSALLFSSNLIPKLFKHRGFSSKYRIKCLYVCLGDRDRGKNNSLFRPLFPLTVMSVFSLFFVLSFILSESLYMLLTWPFEGVPLLTMNSIFPWQIKRSIKASKCHLYLSGQINKIARAPCLFIHNSRRIGDINHVA